jgi:WD40 repeat protein
MVNPPQPSTLWMSEAAQSKIISITTPNRSFEGHVSTVNTVAVFPDGRRMMTGSSDRTLRLWDLKDGAVLKKMRGHDYWIRAVAVSRDGQLIASSDDDGKLIIWHGDTGESLTQAIKTHSNLIYSLDFSPDGAVLATGSLDKTTTRKLWNTKTCQMHGNPINCGCKVYCVWYSPSGELAIGTDKCIELWNPRTRECIAKWAVMTTYSLVWTLDGTRLLSGHYTYILEWDTSTWEEIGYRISLDWPYFLDLRPRRKLYWHFGRLHMFWEAFQCAPMAALRSKNYRYIRAFRTTDLCRLLHG